MKENRFAFIVHPENRQHWLKILNHLQINARNSKARAMFSNKKAFDNSEPFQIIKLSFSIDEKLAVCDVILCPMLPGEMIADEVAAVSQILRSIEFAKTQGARLVGLGGFTSIIGNGGLEISRQATVPVTSGNTYTASSVVNAIIRASKSLNMDLSKSCIAIIGATGDIGSGCSKSLAGLFEQMILVARDDQRLEQLAQLLRPKSSVFVEKRASKAARAADVVLTVTSSVATLLEAADFKKNSIVCDVSYPANIAKEVGKLRPDVLVFEGGIVKSRRVVSQLKPNSLFWDFNPKGGMHACFAETLILALEEKFCTYSIGRSGITLEKMSEMADLADKYDFYPIFSWDGSIIEKNFE